MKYDKPEVKNFILGVYFDSQWPSIGNNEVNLQIEYPYGMMNAAKKYNVRLKNLYCNESRYIEDIIAKNHGLPFFQIPKPDGEPRGSVIEIELPVKNLQHIFKPYYSNIKASHIDKSLVEDELEMHLARNGRSKKHGPTTQWLIDHLWEYDLGFVRDVGNRAIEYFSFRMNAFEDRSIKHISGKNVFDRHYIIRRYVDDDTEWYKPAFFADRSFIHKDMLPDSLLENDYYKIVNKQYELPLFTPIIPYDDRAKTEDIPLKKVRVMVEHGLTLEAVCILNGYLEALCKRTLIKTIMHKEKQEKIEKMQYGDILCFLQTLIAKRKITVGGKYITNAKEIYKYRNEYIHALKYPEESPFLTYIKRVEIEQLIQSFSGAYESHQFLIFLDCIKYEIEEIVKDGTDVIKLIDAYK